MKNHIITIILLVVAVIAFVMHFLVKENVRVYFDVATFVFPTFAALVEIVVSEKKGKVTEAKIKKLKDNQLSARVDGETLYLETGVEK